MVYRYYLVNFDSIKLKVTLIYREASYLSSNYCLYNLSFRSVAIKLARGRTSYYIIGIKQHNTQR